MVQKELRLKHRISMKLQFSDSSDCTRTKELMEHMSIGKKNCWVFLLPSMLLILCVFLSLINNAAISQNKMFLRVRHSSSFYARTFILPGLPGQRVT